MNEKEAREIINKYSGQWTEEMKQERGKYIYALGFIEAIEKANGLEEVLDEALDQIKRFHHRLGDFNDKVPCDSCKKIGDALAKWEKEK